MMDFKKLLNEFKQASQIEKFNFIASLVTVSGVSVFTVLSGINKLDTYRIGFYSVYFGLVLALVSILIGFYYWVVMSIKNDASPIYFSIAFIILTSVGFGFLLIIVTAAWEFITLFNFRT